MTEKLLKLIGAWSVILLFLGCATTRITSQDSGADIYLDNRYVGTGDASILSLGPPKTAGLEARKNGRVVGKTTMSRRFKFRTILWGLVSYYTGLYWGWYYPERVSIYTRQMENDQFNYESPWSAPAKDNTWTRGLTVKSPAAGPKEPSRTAIPQVEE